LALAISDLLQNNKSGIGPSKEHSHNAKYSKIFLSQAMRQIECFAVYESSLELHADGKSKIAVTAQLSLN
jgi:hypothetical protein